MRLTQLRYGCEAHSHLSYYCEAHSPLCYECEAHSHLSYYCYAKVRGELTRSFYRPFGRRHLDLLIKACKDCTDQRIVGYVGLLFFLCMCVYLPLWLSFVYTSLLLPCNPSSLCLVTPRVGSRVKQLVLSVHLS